MAAHVHYYINDRLRQKQEKENCAKNLGESKIYWCDTDNGFYSFIVLYIFAILNIYGSWKLGFYWLTVGAKINTWSVANFVRSPGLSSWVPFAFCFFLFSPSDWLLTEGENNMLYFQWEILMLSTEHNRRWVAALKSSSREQYDAKIKNRWSSLHLLQKEHKTLHILLNKHKNTAYVTKNVTMQIFQCQNHLQQLHTEPPTHVCSATETRTTQPVPKACSYVSVRMEKYQMLNVTITTPLTACLNPYPKCLFHRWASCGMAKLQYTTACVWVKGLSVSLSSKQFMQTEFSGRVKNKQLKNGIHMAFTYFWKM